MGLRFPGRHVREKEDPVLQPPGLLPRRARLRSELPVLHVCPVPVPVWIRESGSGCRGLQSSPGVCRGWKEKFGGYSDSEFLFCWDQSPASAGVLHSRLEGSECVYFYQWTRVSGAVEVKKSPFSSFYFDVVSLLLAGGSQSLLGGYWCREERRRQRESWPGLPGVMGGR